MSDSKTDGGRLALLAGLILYWVVWPLVLAFATFSSAGSIVVAVGLCILWVFTSIILCCCIVKKLFPNFTP